MDQKTHADPAEDSRSFLKSSHKKVYFLCRFFADNYKEHQQLFATAISAAAIATRGTSDPREKENLFLRACINMAALHSISRKQDSGRQELTPEEIISFKSPDYQKTMLQFRKAIDGLSDIRKMLLFLRLENRSPGEISEISGLAPSPSRKKQSKTPSKKEFIPSIKEKLTWS